MKTLNYSYTTPEEAIASLERAYTNNDLEGVFNSKDFIEEAKLILEQAKYDYDLSDEELLEATAELLQLGLTQSIQENGFPDFSNLRVEHSGLQEFREGIYVINEKITYPDDTIWETRIFLSCKNDVWKVVTIEE
jgi:hypothetical protein